MMAALHDYRHIWRVTTLQRQSESNQFMRWTALLLACAALVVVAIALVREPWAPLTLLFLFSKLALGFGAIWLGLVYGVLFVPASIRMNSAANARLLPRQRRRLVQMAAGGWLATSVGGALALGNWGALLLFGLYLLGFALARAGQPQMIVLAVVAGNWPALSHKVFPPAFNAALDSDAALLALTLALLGAAAWVLRWLYPAGGDAHRERDVRLADGARLAGVGVGVGASESQVPVDRFALWWGRFAYAAALRRDCRAPRPDAMLLHALGPTVHTSIWIGSAVFMLVLGGVAHLALALSGNGPGHALVAGVATGGLGALTVAVLLSTMPYDQAMRRTRGEQGLLRLSPLAGDTASMNRRLAGALLRRGLASSLGLTAAILVTTALVEPGMDVLLRQGALCCLAGQMAMLALFGDGAGDDAGNGGWNLRLGLTAGVMAAFEALVALGLGRLGGTLPWPWLIVIALAGAVFVSWRGWRRMLAAPPVFPAGRF